MAYGLRLIIGFCGLVALSSSRSYAIYGAPSLMRFHDRICRIDLLDENASPISFATGMLIQPDLVATSLHVLEKGYAAGFRIVCPHGRFHVPTSFPKRMRSVGDYELKGEFAVFVRLPSSASFDEPEIKLAENDDEWNLLRSQAVNVWAIGFGGAAIAPSNEELEKTLQEHYRGRIPLEEIRSMIPNIRKGFWGKWYQDDLALWRLGKTRVKEIADPIFQLRMPAVPTMAALNVGRPETSSFSTARLKESPGPSDSGGPIIIETKGREFYFMGVIAGSLPTIWMIRHDVAEGIQTIFQMGLWSLLPPRIFIERVTQKTLDKLNKNNCIRLLSGD